MARPKVEINAGALIVVTINGKEKRFSCSGATRPGKSPDQIIKSIQDCVRSSIASATKK